MSDASQKLERLFADAWDFQIAGVAALRHRRRRPSLRRTQLPDRVPLGFDVRAFHDRVLASGAVPLDLLEKNVMGWIAAGGG